MLDLSKYDLSILNDVERSPKKDSKGAFFSRKQYAKCAAPAIVRACIRKEDLKTLQVYEATPELVAAVKANADFSREGCVKALGDALGHGVGISLGLHCTKKRIWLACRDNAALAFRLIAEEEEAVGGLVADLGFASPDELIEKIDSLPSFTSRTTA